jgi:hypothetical protein
VLRLTLLAPAVIEAILAGRHQHGLLFAVLMQPFPVGWHAQIATFAGGSCLD